MRASEVLRRAKEIYLKEMGDDPGANFTNAIHRAANELGASEGIRTWCLSSTWENQDAVIDRAIALAEEEESG